MRIDIIKASALIDDLAQVLRQGKWMVWKQMPLGSVWAGCGIADLVAIKRSYEHPLVTIYEIKTSRADFNRDITNGKYQRYLEHCNRLLFATPAGMVNKEEVPTACGLIVRGPKGWQVRKSAPAHESNLNITFLMALLMKGYGDWKDGRDLRDRERWLRNYSLRDLAREFGVKVGQSIAESDELVKAAEELRQKVSDALGTPFNSLWQARDALKGDVELLLHQRRGLPMALDLAILAMRLFRGEGVDHWVLKRALEKLDTSGQG